uniref:E3 ubiquitin-protein ligase E3D n=1 Tax=Cyprinus carpio TaxID=7962 RepID=A0A8C1SKI7_CYPCA
MNGSPLTFYFTLTAVTPSGKMQMSKQDSILSVQTYQVKLTLRLNVEQPKFCLFGVSSSRSSYFFLCQSCVSMVLQDRAFGRVLPLPNGNWNALVDDWCCPPDPFANRKLCVIRLGNKINYTITLFFITRKLYGDVPFKSGLQVISFSCNYQLWLLNTDSVVASFPDAAARADDKEHQSCRAVKAVKVLYILCSDSKLKDVHPLQISSGSNKSLKFLHILQIAWLKCLPQFLLFLPIKEAKHLSLGSVFPHLTVKSFRA